VEVDWLEVWVADALCAGVGRAVARNAKLARKSTVIMALRNFIENAREQPGL